MKICSVSDMSHRFVAVNWHIKCDKTNKNVQRKGIVTMLNQGLFEVSNFLRRIFLCFGFLLTTLLVLGTSSAQENPINSPSIGSQPEGLPSAETEDCDIATPCGKELIEKLSRAQGDRGAVDGVGAAARFNHPDGIAIDGFGNLYVVDKLNSTIRKITPSGVVSTFAGVAKITGSADGKGSAARFYNPSGITIDAAGNLYVADSLNDTIRKITPDGMVTTIAGMPGTREPSSPELKTHGNKDGKRFDARFDYPNGITIDDEGNLYVITPSTVRKITPDLIATTLAGGVVYGDEDTKSDGQGTAIRFNSLTGIAVDSQHNIYVADAGNSTIRKITQAGYVSTIAGFALKFGGDDGKGASARFKNLRGISIDSADNLFVADIGGHSIRKITPDGVVSTFLGVPNRYKKIDGERSPTEFITPYGVAVDSNSDIFITDVVNQSIRKLSHAGGIATVAGPNG